MDNVRLWLPVEEIEAQAVEQIEEVSRLPILAGPIAVMPDCHFGKGAPVGTVIPTKTALIPASVGVDIGCGMIAVKTTLAAAQLPDDLSKIRSYIEHAIPVGFNANTPDDIAWDKVNILKPGLDVLLSKTPDLLDRRKAGWQEWINQVGSLGGGNHFIEICLDESDSVWVMLHSGSRGVGNTIGEYYITKAKEFNEKHRHWGLINKELAWLSKDDISSELFDDYWNALEWAQKYAALNRAVMLDRLISVLHKAIPTPFKMAGMAVNCHHNYVTYEPDFGSFITRKGAISVKAGELGIIPGSMGASSYIVEGIGNPDSYCSCSHGAGRKMSRGAAKRHFTREDLEAQTQGVECRKDSGVIDEIPGAYKDIDTVIERQKDLIKIVAKLKQVLCVKG